MSDRAAVSPDPGRSAGCGERFRDETGGEGDIRPGDWRHCGQCQGQAIVR